LLYHKKSVRIPVSPTPNPFFLAFVFAREIENGSRKLEGEIEERGK